MRAAEANDGRDWTPYVIITPTGSTEPLRKRRAVLALVTALYGAGVSPAAMAQALPGGPRLLSVEGTLDGTELQEAFIAAYPAAGTNLGRWFVESPLHGEGRTWLLSKMWGADTVDALDALLNLAPNSGFDYEAG